LFSGGRDDGSEANKDACAFEGSERARDFHFDLGHAQVLFGQVVGAWDVEVDQEAQGLVLEGREADEEIVAGTLLLSFFRVRRRVEGRQRAMEGKPGSNGLPVAIDEALNALRPRALSPASLACRTAFAASGRTARMSSAHTSLSLSMSA
jgi:hypothetical protein